MNWSFGTRAADTAHEAEVKRAFGRGRARVKDSPTMVRALEAIEAFVLAAPKNIPGQSSVVVGTHGQLDERGRGTLWVQVTIFDTPAVVARGPVTAAQFAEAVTRYGASLGNAPRYATMTQATFDEFMAADPAARARYQEDENLVVGDATIAVAIDNAVAPGMVYLGPERMAVGVEGEWVDGAWVPLEGEYLPVGPTSLERDPRDLDPLDHQTWNRTPGSPERARRPDPTIERPPRRQRRDPAAMIGTTITDVLVSPSVLTTSPGRRTTLIAYPRDTAGNAVRERTITWSSTNDDIASVSQDGVVYAYAVGECSIVATCDGKQGSTRVRVALS